MCYYWQVEFTMNISSHPSKTVGYKPKEHRAYVRALVRATTVTVINSARIRSSVGHIDKAKTQI